MTDIGPDVLGALRALEKWSDDLGFRLELVQVRPMDNARRKAILAEFRDTLRLQERERKAIDRAASVPRPRQVEAVRVPIPTVPARRAPERPVREAETPAAIDVAPSAVPTRLAPSPRAARPAPPSPRRELPPAAQRFGKRVTETPHDPNRDAELAEIEQFLEKKGGAAAVRVPGVGDPAIDDLPPLVWDKFRRIHTRDPNVKPPASGDWRVVNRHGGRKRNESAGA